MLIVKEGCAVVVHSRPTLYCMTFNESDKWGRTLEN